MGSRIKYALLLFILFTNIGMQLSAQDSLGIFKDDKPLEISVSTDLKKLISEKENETMQKAQFSMTLPDGKVLSAPIDIKARGHFRKELCQIPPVNLVFKNNVGPFKYLKTLKLVNACKPGSSFEQLIFKEYLCYLMFCELTPMSLKVRLVHVNFMDSANRRKPFIYYGFVIEDMGLMAKRNGFKEVKRERLHTELANRDYMTLVATFQYLIGNTDWSVPAVHNIKFMVPKDSLETAKAYAVPYDFDYCGMVDAPYAEPDELLGITKVTERVYRGYPRTMDELQQKVDLYNSKKDKFYGLVRNCTWLEKNTVLDMIDYLDQFYKTINDPKALKNVFIENARRD